MTMRKLTIDQLANGITKCCIKNISKNTEFNFNDIDYTLCMKHENNNFNVSFIANHAEPNSIVLFCQFDTQHIKSLDPLSAVNDVYKQVNELSNKTISSITEPFYKRLNLSNDEITFFLNSQVNNSHSFIDYSKHTLLPKTIEADNKFGIKSFLRSVVRQEEIEKWLKQSGISQKELYKVGLRPISEDDFYIRRFKEELLDDFFNKNHPHFQNVMSNFIAKVELETVEKINYKFDEDKGEGADQQKVAESKLRKLSNK